MSDDVETRLARLEAEVQALRLENQAVQFLAERSAEAVVGLSNIAGAHELLLINLVHAMPGIRADVDDALAQPNFPDVVGQPVVDVIRAFRERMDAWRAATAAGRVVGAGRVH